MPQAAFVKPLACIVGNVSLACAGALDIRTYEGQIQGPTKEVVTAQDLASADIVLTTYDVLAKDIWRQPDPDQAAYSLRREKKYQVRCQ